jgi:hypothetical protein
MFFHAVPITIGSRFFDFLFLLLIIINKPQRDGMVIEILFVFYKNPIGVTYVIIKILDIAPLELLINDNNNWL